MKGMKVMAKNLDNVVLFDVYGKLLTKIQYDTLDLCYNEDLSLAEIADVQGGKTRQSVVYTINKSQEKLSEYEEKLGIAKRLHNISDSIENLKRLLIIIEDKLTDDEINNYKNIILNINNNL